MEVMGNPKLRLFCTWHVDRAWRKNLSQMKGNKEIQGEIYKIISPLMEVRDKQAFEQMLKEAINHLLGFVPLMMSGRGVTHT